MPGRDRSANEAAVDRHARLRDENAKLRCHEIRRVNEELQPWLAACARAAGRRAQANRQRLRAQSILTSREYAFCLYPAEPLRQLMEMPQVANEPVGACSRCPRRLCIARNGLRRVTFFTTAAFPAFALARTTFSTVKPKCLNSAPAGAEAP